MRSKKDGRRTNDAGKPRLDLHRTPIAIILPLLIAAGVACSKTAASPDDVADGGEPDKNTVDGPDGGEPDQSTVDGAGVSFVRDVFPIVETSCAVTGCHISATAQNHSSDFSTPDSTYARWVNGPGTDFCVDPSELFVQRTVVVPGDPDSSFLLMKITSTREDLCNDMHQPRMPPPPRPTLSQVQIETISSWIREGARQN